MKCCICGKEIKEQESNNALPIKDGRCCNECNESVIEVRIKIATGLQTIKERPNESYAVILTPNDKVMLFKKDQGRFSLQELQSMVGGYIEVYPYEYENYIFLVDEDGLVKELEFNSLAYNLFNIKAVGNVVIVSKNMLN